MTTRRSTYAVPKRGNRAQSSRGTAQSASSNSRKDLIPLDTHSLRKKALKTHRQAERALAQLKDKLKRYHDQDVPGFRSWVHRTFGHLLTRQRELQHAIEEKQILIFEIQTMADRYRISDLAAYRKVLWRRAHPDEAQAEDRQFEEDESRRQSRAKGTEADDLFGDEAFDDIPGDESDDFKDFFERRTGIRLPSHKPDHPHPDEKSVKELYRHIVRRLHPDHHGQMNDARKSLWHEAQEAYRRHDLNALHSVLARCDEGEAGLGDHSPVSLIRRLTKSLKAATQAARRDIRKMQRDAAWDYETRIRNPQYVRAVRADLEDIVRELQWTLDDIERELAHLDRLATRQAQRNRPLRKPRQDELPFC
jgi:hypothetical protein